MKSLWQGLAPGLRVSLIAGVLLVVAAMGCCAWWLLRTDYQVLFTDLKPQDAAVMTAELDKLKVPYAVDEDGTTLLVNRADVHATRMKLMGKDLPIHGAVGFELFNNTDFGMTEFAQKINYQRALQGELTRTILALAEIRDARVHVALPEQGLFRQAASKPKAAVTLTRRQGSALRAEQVAGIQRLVAAAVPGMAAQEVTIVDNQGVALSRSGAETEADTFASSARLDFKRETENYLSRKAGAVLERAFGPGQAIASVDVTLNMDQVRVTTEDVVAAPGAQGGLTGVIVRERESTKEVPAPLDVRADFRGGARGGGATQREVEYQTGRRVEQVVSQPGSIRRIQVVAVVRQPLDEERQEQVRKMIAAVVGASPERGDTIVVQAFDATAGPAAIRVPPEAAQPASARDGTADVSAHADSAPSMAWLAAAAIAIAALLAGTLLLLRRRRVQRPHALTGEQREAALRTLQDWMKQDEGFAAPSAAGAASGMAP